MTAAPAKILHVEDDFSLQRLVRASLERIGGYAVHTAASGYEAVEAAGAFDPDLVLLDLDLPGLDGIETLKALRGLAGLGEVPAVFLTATCDPRLIGRLDSVGALCILGKPFRPRELVKTVETALQRKPQ